MSRIRGNRTVVWLTVGAACIGLALWATACWWRLEPTDRAPEPPEISVVPPGPIVLRDVLNETGITFRHTDGSGGHYYIVESVCCGMATFDYDGDGLIDIYFLNGAPLRGTPTGGPPPRNALYRNLGDWQFVDVTDQAGVGDTGFGLGVTVGDYDNDGYPDLYLNNFGPNVLYHNNGDGTFTVVTREAGVAAGDQVGAGACFLDADGNGTLDLYAANYVDFTYENHVPSSIHGVPAYAGPVDYRGVPDVFYGNNGDGTFTDLSQASGIASVATTSMGMICADYDDDGDTDIFICNDVNRNLLFQNDGRGHFCDVALTVGTAYNFQGVANASMGVDCGDYQNDGRLDFFMTDYQLEFAVLYENTGNGLFQDVTRIAEAGQILYAHVNWGTGFCDFDNDGHRDLFVANGHLQDRVEQYSDTASYRAKNTLLRNTGQGRFVDVTDSSGDGMQIKLSSRGVALDDLDNDGRVDVVVLNTRCEPSVLRNESPTDDHWLQIHVRGTTTNRDGVGARVTVVAGDCTWVDEVHSGRGYQSHFGSRLHFGLGRHDRVDRVEVRWIGGGCDVREHVATNQLITIIETGPTR